MNGIVVNSWPYVIAAYAVTWAVLLGYAVRLIRMARRTRATNVQPGER